MTYYDRQKITHVDGTNIFQTPEDSKNEQDVALVLEAAWKCKLNRFGALCPIDWFAERNGRVVGLVELKCRSHCHDRYPTVFLSVRKWLSLVIGSIGMACPGIFVVRFDDGARWVSISDVDASKQRIGGAINTVEPVIEVPIEILTRLDQE